MHLFPFVVTVVRELVDGFGVTSLDGIVVDDVVVGLGEDFESVFVFLFGSIASSVVGDEVNEFLFNLGHWSGQEACSGDV